MALDDRLGFKSFFFYNSSSGDHECLLPNFTDINPIIFRDKEKPGDWEP